MATIDDIRDAFSILHDGGIEAWTGNKDLLTLTVSCRYLAERIDPSFERFYVALHHIDRLELDPWMVPVGTPSIIKTDFQDIFQAELEILSSVVKGDVVVVACNQHDTSWNYCGGNLMIACKGIVVYDQARKVLTIDQLDELCNAYWDEFGKR